MKTYTLQAVRDGQTYEARLNEMGGIAYESVSLLSGADEPVEIHDAEFPARNLGTASRESYLATMLPSVLDAQDRAARFGISLSEALAGRIPA